ncbi:isopentenyl transferase family protein [Xanthomonas translucens pv. graminis]|uniref:isopentenyl transferase family protein n=1 Tax=Xanthomonas graminis TaxID=3390026 RepID=UPI0025407A6B|nr:isopentenyl transferase family protein [Xanthomonas translucens]WIH05584.1 isopentenyl transferase family protein [Xanthomonas translucens pv. graminis]
MNVSVHLIWGPTCSGKTAAAVALAERSGLPVVALDRIQCCPALATGSGRPLPSELRGTRRIYLASRRLSDGMMIASEANALLKHAVARHGGSGAVILEGGSISLLRKMMADPHWANGFRWSSRRFRLGDPAAFLDRARRRVEQMLRADQARPSLLQELAVSWADPALRPVLEDVDGYRYAIRFAQQWGVPVSRLPDMDAQLRQRLVQGIAEEYLGHAQWQERDLGKLPATWQPLVQELPA